VKSIITRVSGPESSEIVLLPPVGSRVPQVFRRATSNLGAYRSILSQVQRFRGRIYLEDEAISPEELTRDGRHILPIDERSWHVISIEKSGEISGCLRFLEESTAHRFDELWLRGAAVAHCPLSGAKVQRAIEYEMARARQERIRFGEVGGWAISKERRCGLEALRIVLSTYALLQLLGGCVGMATATVRHGSSAILRKFGLASLCADDGPVAPYYDPQYACQMEMLRFDSRRANSRFMGWIEELTDHLTTAMVIGSYEPAPVLHSWRGSVVDDLSPSVKAAVA
jgi:hypothetical protein